MKPLTVLVVEDNAITLRMIKVALESAGYVVLAAPDGRTALELAGTGRPDLILQDLLLPDIDGFDLVKRFRKLPGGPGVPILAVSGFTPGLDEAMRSASLKVTPHAMLSRAISGIRRRTLIITLPGSPKGATENLRVVLPALEHAVKLLREEDAGH